MSQPNGETTQEHEEIDASQEAGDSQNPQRLVPLAESIKYRRRAQQAEGKAQDVQQQLEQLRGQLHSQQEQLTLAEAQRDEARQHLAATENRLAAERLLLAGGVVDADAAWLLLSKRVDTSAAIDAEALARGVEQLLVDKPYLCQSRTAALPARTAAPQSPTTSNAARLAQTAQRAARSGDRRDVAEYLRLRRQSSPRPQA